MTTTAFLSLSPFLKMCIRDSHSLVYRDKFSMNSFISHQPLQLHTGKSRIKAKCCILKSKVLQDVYKRQGLYFLVLNCSLMISPFFARCSLSSVYFIPSTPSAPLFRTTCRYALLRLSLDNICSIRLLVSMRSFLSVSLDLTTLFPIGYGRCCHFCNTRHTQTY